MKEFIPLTIYFLRKKGTTDQYYQRRGGRRINSGADRGKRVSKWGPMSKAACWTSPNGPRPVKGDDDIVGFELGIEII